MANAKYSAEDLKLETENIEYAGGLNKVSSGENNAPEAIIVTEEDVSPPPTSTTDQ